MKGDGGSGLKKLSGQASSTPPHPSLSRSAQQGRGESRWGVGEAKRAVAAQVLCSGPYLLRRSLMEFFNTGMGLAGGKGTSERSVVETR